MAAVELSDLKNALDRTKKKRFVEINKDCLFAGACCKVSSIKDFCTEGGVTQMWTGGIVPEIWYIVISSQPVRHCTGFDLIRSL